MSRRICVLVSALTVLVGACGSSGGTAASSPSSLSGTISVFAAASLTNSFFALGKSFQQAHPSVAILTNFAGTPTLVTQIEQGAQADVFASADTTNMAKLTTDGLTTGSSPIFAHNKLEIVVAPGNPKGITGLADLAKPGLIYITEGPSVPAGKYALQALAMAGVKVTPKSLETAVTGVISKIELGEADAGIVYTTDVQAAGTKVQGVPIPDAQNVIATYPISAVKGSKNLDVANAFIAYILSDAGQTTLATFGFQHA